MTGGGVELHASALAAAGRAALILGPSGAGKSSFALTLLALGAGLVADDRVRLWGADGGLMVGPLDPGRGQGTADPARL
ncbi:MAG: hypothetical protein Q4F71_08380, partial [Paracoccus sp. (in: a-proteobacteria)]|nr:hypothetical protein [Paracoccus sp. (in: a-proteobacteria)]